MSSGANGRPAVSPAETPKLLPIAIAELFHPAAAAGLPTPIAAPAAVAAPALLPYARNAARGPGLCSQEPVRSPRARRPAPGARVWGGRARGRSPGEGGSLSMNASPNAFAPAPARCPAPAITTG